MRGALATCLGAAVLVFALGAPRAPAQSFTIDDRVVSNPGKSIIDPEFDNTGWRIIFNDGSDKLWVGSIDSTTGQLNPPSARGILLDSLVARVAANGVSNGPEWGFSRRGAEVFYTDLNGDVPELASMIQVGGVWTRVHHDSAAYRALPLVSKDTTFDAPYLSYLYLIDYGLGQPTWRIAGNAASEVILPLGSASGGGRWINGQHAFMTLGADVNGVKQATRYDCDTGIFTQLTSDPGDKEEPWMVKSAEYPGEYWLICLVPSESILAVYRQVEGAWTRVNALRPPSRNPYLLSPEPFTYAGRNYAALQCAAVPTEQNSVADIWITALAPGGPPFYRLVSDTTLLARRDPEPFILTGGPVVYYTEVFGSQHMLHRCFTGLAPYPPTAVGGTPVAPRLSLEAARPVPSGGRVALSYSLETPAAGRLVILTAGGRALATLVDRPLPAGRATAVWDGRDAAGRPVPSGVYLALLEAGGARVSRRLVIAR